MAKEKVLRNSEVYLFSPEDCVELYPYGVLDGDALARWVVVSSRMQLLGMSFTPSWCVRFVFVVFYTVDGCFFRIRVEIKLWLDGSSAAAVACGSWCIGLLVSISLGLRWRFCGACSGYSTVVYLGFKDESGHCQRVKGISSLNRLGVVAAIVFQYAFLH
ncbi:hypothetical protein DY000_02015558 [Brassica cretica]|uniref:Transmembrane protein n=1 Tax=Brassica cretica TaxID=69181 RepID=A0ABQ7CWH7_BRACR|nr:hypothetical protein DY000_02015558 [Brassica cretica]